MNSKRKLAKYLLPSLVGGKMILYEPLDRERGIVSIDFYLAIQSLGHKDASNSLENIGYFRLILIFYVSICWYFFVAKSCDFSLVLLHLLYILYFY